MINECADLKKSTSLFVLFTILFSFSLTAQTIKSISSTICDSINHLDISDEAELIQAQRSIYNYELVKYPTLIVDIMDLNKPRQFNEFNYKINRELLRDCPGFINQFSFLPLTKILDVEGLFNSNQYDSLERAIIDFIITKKVDLLIVSIEDLYPYENFEEFSENQSIDWNVGSRYENGGVLIVLSKSKNESYVTINKRLKDKINEKVCDDILKNTGQPEFEKGYYFKGLLLSIEALKSTIEGN